MFAADQKSTVLLRSCAAGAAPASPGVIQPDPCFQLEVDGRRHVQAASVGTLQNGSCDWLLYISSLANF